MASGFNGDFFYGGGGGSGRPSTAAIGGVSPLLLRQQQQQQQQQQQSLTSDQIAQRRAELLMGGGGSNKRSFAAYQSYQQPINFLQQQQQQLQQQHQQQQQPFAFLQRQQQQHQHQQQQQSQSLSLLLQQQYLMRSVKQRANNNIIINNNNNNGFANSSPISPLSPCIDLCSPNSSSSVSHEFVSSPRFGVPLYQQQQQQQLRSQLQQQQQQQQQQPPMSSLLNNHTQLNNNTNNPSFTTTITTTSNNNYNNNNQTFQSVGLSNANPIQPKPEPQENKISNALTLEELEKQLLNDDFDDDVTHEEGDAVSVITNSEWSETFQNLITTEPNSIPSPGPNPSPNPAQNSTSTSGSNNTTTIPNNNNNMVSPSPTSSTSSCCSTSASPATPPPISAKQLIAEIATAISDGKVDPANELLTRLAQVANPKGSSEQRLAYYMGNALRSRASPTENPPPVTELYGREQMTTIYSLYDLSPCFKFGLLAANLVMLEAITSALQENSRVHVIDFDVGHAGQYVNLIRALAERRSQCAVRITAVETATTAECGPATAVREVLMSLAEKLGIKLRFDVVTRTIHELTRESLGCEDGESIVVNFAFKLYRVPDESVSMENLRDELLRRVKGLSPRAVTLVEQDMNANTAPFVTRVNECVVYYGALFDSLESTHPARDNSDRVRVEEGLGRKMANSVACEGRERVERAEVFGKWRARMGMAGFELKPLSQSVAESMRAKLNSGRGGNPGFTVKEESGGVGFGWMGRTLTVASAWR